jgi:hypothetical protein
LGVHNRRRKPGKRKSRKKLAYGAIAVFFMLACFFVYFSLNSSPPEAAIVDHLSFFPEQRNSTFVDACKNILETNGLTWAYHNGEEVTVNFYRNLPSCGTSLIILRVHSAIMRTEKGTISILGLFTSERYSDDAAKKYREDVLNDRLVKAFFPEGEEEYFGIVPKFVEESMKGDFKNTIIIMMGCEGLGYDGLTYTEMAEAFVKKGAKVYIGWDGIISLDHTDQATVHLLQSLLLHKRTIKGAVTETMEIVGKDPTYNSTLLYYPETPEAGNYTIPNLTRSLIMNVILTSLTPKATTKTKSVARGQCQILAKAVP